MRWRTPRQASLWTARRYVPRRTSRRILDRRAPDSVIAMAYGIDSGDGLISPLTLRERGLEIADGESCESYALIALRAPSCCCAVLGALPS